MENARAAARVGSEVDEILGSLCAELKQAEAQMVSMLEGIVADNATYLTELEAALADMEAALAGD